MKLYYSVGACSLAVRILINELNMACEFEAVDGRTKKTASGGDFLTINPKGEVPVLVLDNGEILTENAVIQEYLVEKKPHPELLPPKEDFRHYRVLEWLNFASTDLHKGFGPLFNPDVPKELKEKIFIPALKKKFALVDQQLAKHPFLTGEHFSLPDGYVFVMLNWFKHFQIDLAIWPHIATFFAAVKKRPAVQKSLEQEGMKI